MSRIDLFAWADMVDAPALMRGASTGFTVLVVGGLTAPLATRLLPVVGVAWLPLVAVAAFSVSGSRIGVAPRPPVHGAAAAVSAYLLVLPLVLLGGGFHAGQAVATAAAALLVGSLAGAVRAKFSRVL